MKTTNTTERVSVVLTDGRNRALGVMIASTTAEYAAAFCEAFDDAAEERLRVTRRAVVVPIL